MSEFANLMEAVSRIRELNLNDKDPEFRVPTSHSLYRKFLSDITSSEDQCAYFLRILTDSHYLFRIQLVEPDDALMIPAITGYIVAEAAVLQSITQYSYGELERAYEQQFYRKTQATTILRELLPQARNYNNTPLGRVLNIALMAQQFERLMTNEFAQYTPTWKRKKLGEIMPGTAEEGTNEGNEDEEETPAHEGPGTPPKLDLDDGRSGRAAENALRAVDQTEKVEELQQMDRSGKWGDAVDKFGVQFLLRIHFRKYEFDRVKWLLRTGKIAREADLRYVRDTIRTMESRKGLDTRLEVFAKDMAEVKRSAQMRLNEIHQARKGTGGETDTDY